MKTDKSVHLDISKIHLVVDRDFAMHMKVFQF